MSKRRRIYKFTEKSHSKRAIAASIVATILIALYLGFVYMAYKNVGGLSTYHGSVGVVAMMASIASLVVAISSFREEDAFRGFPRLAFVTSLTATVCWLGTYVMGFV